MSNNPTQVDNATVITPIEVDQNVGQFANDVSPQFRGAQERIAAAHAELNGKPPAPAAAIDPLSIPAITPNIVPIVTSNGSEQATVTESNEANTQVVVADDRDKRIAELDSRLSAAIKKLNDDDGSRGSELKRRHDRIVELESLIEASKQTNSSPDSIPDTATREKSEADAMLAALTPEQREQFPELADMSMRMIQAKAKLSTANYAPSAPAQEVAALKADIARIHAASDAVAFQTSVDKQSPGFAADNPNAALGVTGNPKFLEFLDAPSAPGSTLTNADIYAAKPSAETAAFIHKQFRQTEGIGAASVTNTSAGPTTLAAMPMTPSPSDLVPPGTRSAAAQSSANTLSGPVFSESEYRNIKNSISQGGGIRDAAVLTKFNDYRNAIISGKFKPIE